MDRFFVCLANSYKHGGRCIAGVEVEWHEDRWRIVRDERQMPRWVRPVCRDTNTGEIPNEVADDVRVLDVVWLKDAEPCADGAQTENVYYTSITAIGKRYDASERLLERFVDESHRHLFYNYSKSIPHAAFATECSYSILLLRVTDAEVFADTATAEYTRYRLRFNYRDHAYDIPITDPDYLRQLSCGHKHVGPKGTLYVTCSLGQLYEGYHHKLAACIFETSQLTTIVAPQDNWFEEYEQELSRLMTQREEIDSRIQALRLKIQQQMETCHATRINSTAFTISYTPARTTMQFDSKAFREEQSDLYANYCRPKTREATITIKRNKVEE